MLKRGGIRLHEALRLLFAALTEMDGCWLPTEAVQR
jgi:hypothetical protein